MASISSSDSNFTSTSTGGTLYFKTEGGSATVNVECGCEWTIENSASDVFATSLSSSSLTVSASQNYVEQDVTGTITFITASARITFATITITQAAYGAPEITVETNEWNAPAAGALTTEIAVEANADWTAESAGSWLTVTKADDGITLTAAENEDTAERSTKVTLTCTDGYRTAHEYITVTQDGAVYISLSNDKVSLSGAGDSVTVTVESNYDWDYSYDSSNGWYTVTRNGDNLTVTSTKDNEAEENFEGTVTVTAGDGVQNVYEAQIAVVEENTSNALILTYTILTAGTSVTLPLQGTVDCTVFWGDGSSEKVTSVMPTHTYEKNGSYDVVINGTVTTLSHQGITSSASKNNTTLTAVKQWGKTGLTDMSYAFAYCSGLDSLVDDTSGAFSDVTDFTYSFRNTSITEIPAGLFTYATKATTFVFTFGSCSMLQTIPEDLFANCTEAITFESCFRQGMLLKEIPEGLFAHNTKAENFNITFYQNNITSIPEGLFAGNTAAKSFSETFETCYYITSIPENLFANCKEADSFYAVFYGCKGLTTVPEGLFAGNTEATNFGKIFASCTSLTSVPEGLFKYNTAATSFSGLFYLNTCITTVPEGLFEYNTSATDFSYLFYGSTGLVSVPEGLFKYNTAAQDFSYLFYGSTGLDSVPEGLFANNAAVKTFSRLFYNCTSLISVPKGLFAGNTATTDFSYLFYGCKGLTSVPEGLFANNTAAENFSYLFYGCTGLTSVPEGIFANNTKVTTLGYVLRGCTGLTSVPENLFASCTEATEMYGCFYSCTSLTSLPAGIFSNNRKVENFNSVCRSATGLTGESPYDEIEVNGATVKVHLYERQNYPDIYATPTGNNGFVGCTKLDDYDAISSAGWN